MTPPEPEWEDEVPDAEELGIEFESAQPAKVEAAPVVEEPKKEEPPVPTPAPAVPLQIYETDLDKCHVLCGIQILPGDGLSNRNVVFGVRVSWDAPLLQTAKLDIDALPVELQVLIEKLRTELPARAKAKQEAALTTAANKKALSTATAAKAKDDQKKGKAEVKAAKKKFDMNAAPAEGPKAAPTTAKVTPAEKPAPAASVVKPATKPVPKFGDNQGDMFSMFSL